ncbi:hypothetical protein FW320_11795 [Azospirillum sp. Vi22]|nr:hypothetical protein [Azospirillum baldaniorum]
MIRSPPTQIGKNGHAQDVEELRRPLRSRPPRREALRPPPRPPRPDGAPRPRPVPERHPALTPPFRMAPYQPEAPPSRRANALRHRTPPPS